MLSFLRESALARAVTKDALARVDAAVGTDLRMTLPVAIRLAARSTVGWGRVRVVLAGALLATRRVNRPLTLSVAGPTDRLRFTVPDHAAFKVMGEIFCDGEYAVDLPSAPRSILDLGSNIGASVLFFRLAYPDARIVAIEPSPNLVGLLRRNTRDLDVEVRDVAVAAESGPLTFYEATESWAGSTTSAVGEPIEVTAVAFDDLLAEDFDFIKIDIEGAEFEILADSSRIAGVSTIIGEIHAAPGTPRSEALLRGLRSTFAVTTNAPGRGAPFTVFKATRTPDVSRAIRP